MPKKVIKAFVIFYNEVKILDVLFFTGMIEGKMDEVLGCFSVPLDGRFTSIRTAESNLGNWVRQLKNSILA